MISPSGSGSLEIALAKGDSNADMRDFLVSRDGDFILLKGDPAALARRAGHLDSRRRRRRFRRTARADDDAGVEREEGQRLAEIGGAGEGANGSR